MSDLSGKKLGNYDLVDRLGKGGMAEVYKAAHLNLARFVAIKVIYIPQTEKEEDADFVERFEREAIAVAGLRHPNIVQVYDFGREEDIYYMVMELIEGPTLQGILKEQRLQNHLTKLAEIAPILNALASAIDYAHSQKIIHRDLKPSNIMFTLTGQVVLTDFGVARLMNAPRYTRTGAIMGTPAYLSPEQARGEEGDEYSDIYSLGTVLYELVTGRTPFDSDNIFTLLNHHLNSPIPPLTTIKPGTPAAVEQVVLKALHKKPADRYRTGRELAEAFTKAINLIALETPMAPDPAPDQTQEGALIEQQTELHPPTIKISPTPSRPDPIAEPSRSTVITIGGNVGGHMGIGTNIAQFGDVSGQLAIGSEHRQLKTGETKEPDEANLAALQRLLTQLKSQIESRTPPDKKDAALERVGELTEAVTGAKPDLDTMAYVKGWFAKNSPTLVNDVTEIIAHPVVRKQIEAAGEEIVTEFRRRFEQ